MIRQSQTFPLVCACMWMVLSLLLVLGATRHATTNAFSTFGLTSCYLHGMKLSPKTHDVLFATYSSQVSNDSDRLQSASPNDMSKAEVSGVKRFTIGYDKLCKNCPTRLQPRVDTLTEMILGLPEEEREELMQNVAKRLLVAQSNGEEKAKITSSRGVYEFQTSGTVIDAPDKLKMEKENNIKPLSTPDSVQKPADKSKLSKKMDKVRTKFEQNKNNVARAKRLLEITNMLLSRHQEELTIDTIDNGWYHEIDLLQKLSRTELKMERLKLTAQKAKHEQKVAKQRLKLYSYSISKK